MSEKYIVGTSPMPEWVQRVLMPYRKLDGSTGYELHTVAYDKFLKKGDKLYRSKKGIVNVRRCFDDAGEKEVE
ncbi:MAG: hypothetical protein NC110_05780 [Ruminococcus sp.]|nr:hypothetical protein [Ruminococcus sp.]